MCQCVYMEVREQLCLHSYVGSRSWIQGARFAWQAPLHLSYLTGQFLFLRTRSYVAQVGPELAL